MVSITKGCAVAGLGGKPVYRTGDYNYYITEKYVLMMRRQ